MLTSSWAILKENISRFLEELSLSYARYIDDIFFILYMDRYQRPASNNFKLFEYKTIPLGLSR